MKKSEFRQSLTALSTDREGEIPEEGSISITGVECRGDSVRKIDEPSATQLLFRYQGLVFRRMMTLLLEKEDDEELTPKDCRDLLGSLARMQTKLHLGTVRHHLFPANPSPVSLEFLENASYFIALLKEQVRFLLKQSLSSERRREQGK